MIRLIASSPKILNSSQNTMTCPSSTTPNSISLCLIMVRFFSLNVLVIRLISRLDIDEALAKHVAHLFIRDPMAVYAELLDQDDTASTDHFENIQSTNWRTMRFKPPPAGSSIGWRVEFRSMEVQLTDVENAAYCVFIVLITRAILSFNLNLYMPLSKVDENMASAQKRDAILKGKMWFRTNIFSDDAPEMHLLSVNDIINGTTHLEVFCALDDALCID